MYARRDMVHEFPFRIDVWDDTDNTIDEVFACTAHLAVARATYDAVLAVRPGKIITLRQGTFVVQKHVPEGLPTKKEYLTPEWDPKTRSYKR